jgi:hypothetical protein
MLALGWIRYALWDATGSHRDYSPPAWRMRRFRLRRLEKVNIEALPIASGQNVKRLLAFGGRRPKNLAQAAALRPLTATSHEISRARKHFARRSQWSTKAYFNTLDRF